MYTGACGGLRGQIPGAGVNRQLWATPWARICSELLSPGSENVFFTIWIPLFDISWCFAKYLKNPCQLYKYNAFVLKIRDYKLRKLTFFRGYKLVTVAWKPLLLAEIVYLAVNLYCVDTYLRHALLIS